MREKDVFGVGNQGMRNARLCTFTCGALQLSEVLGLDGDLGSADAVMPIGKGLLGGLVQTCPKCVCVGVAGLSCELAEGHLEICADQRVNIKLVFRGIVSLWLCGLTVLVNARYSLIILQQKSDGELDRIRTCEFLWSLGRALYPLSYQPLSHSSI